MKTKICSKCKKRKRADKFSKKTSAKDGLNPTCRVCHRQYVNSHYDRNKDYYKKKGTISREKLRKELTTIVREAKSKPCTDCKQPYPYYIMDLDHVKNEKVLEVSRMLLRSSKMDLLKEINKCDVVCANCHRERTQQRMLQ